MVLMRPDFRLPPSVKEVGPSASILFHGGDTAFDLRASLEAGSSGVSTRRRLAGGSSL